MKKTLIFLAASGLMLVSCEPTERKVNVPPPAENNTDDAAAVLTEELRAQLKAEIAAELRGEMEAKLKQEVEAITPVVVPPVQTEPQPEGEPAAEAEAPAAQESEPVVDEPAAEPEVVDVSLPLLTVAMTLQDYDRLKPWEKQQATSARMNGVYLGNGRVLTLGRNLAKANYVEIGLPNASRTVAARVVRYDADLNLGLLEVMREEDASVFETRKALELGDPMNMTSTASLWCTLDGVQAAEIPLQAEVGVVEHGLPRLQMRAEQAVPGNYSHGAPVVADGRLVGISDGYNAAGRKLKVINAELIERFLNADASTPTGVPQMGVTLAELTDPVFRRYLKIDGAQSGVYLSAVEPMGAAAAAGLKQGDVLTAVEGMEIDNRGRCRLGRYGMVDAATVVRYLKPLGQSINLSYRRDGETLTADMALNRDASEKALVRTEQAGVPPRYLIWGGMVFQPLSTDYLEAVKAQTKGVLPSTLMSLQDREDALRESGYRELTVLSMVLPTKATLGYDNCGLCLVEKVNGKEAHSFAEFVELLRTPTESGMVELSINKAPYKLYMEAAAAEAAGAELKRSGIIQLERLTEQP